MFASAADGTVFDSNGDSLPFDPVVFVGTAIAMPSARGTLNEVGGLFAHLQCFAGADSNDAFLELTFLPADITCPGDPLVEVVRFLNGLCIETSVAEYFVRYENASWKLGDPTGAGVIFTRSQVASLV